MQNEKKSVGAEIAQLLKANIKSYMMYIALVVIMLVFQIWSGGKFFRASNISNLFNQAAYVAVLAIGMTLILILKHIDLSVGYVAGFTGAIAAVLMQRYGVNEWLAILIVLAIGHPCFNSCSPSLSITHPIPPIPFPFSLFDVAPSEIGRAHV